jgi:hypothetical protein
METNRPFEKHAVSIVAAVILAVMLWVGSTTIKLSESVVKLEERSAGSTQSMVEVRQEVAALKTQVTVAALAAANAATAALASLQQQQQQDRQQHDRR